MNHIYIIFAKNLKTLRRMQNLTQAVLAEKCDLSTNYIAEMEAGKKFPSPRTLEKIAEVLMVKPYRLLIEPDKTVLFNKEELTGWVIKEMKREIDSVVAKYLKQNDSKNNEGEQHEKRKKE